jgi:hypothetical protein
MANSLMQDILSHQLYARAYLLRKASDPNRLLREQGQSDETRIRPQLALRAPTRPGNR